MIDILRQTYLRLLNELEFNTFRYLYHSFRIEGRLTGLVGPRGVGKTTLLLQFIKNQIHNPAREAAKPANFPKLKGHFKLLQSQDSKYPLLQKNTLFSRDNPARKNQHE